MRTCLKLCVFVWEGNVEREQENCTGTVRSWLCNMRSRKSPQKSAPLMDDVCVLMRDNIIARSVVRFSVVRVINVPVCVCVVLRCVCVRCVYSER